MRTLLIAVAVVATGVITASAQSFSCSGRLTMTEFAICNSSTLGALDEALASRYYYVRGRLRGNARARRRLRNLQRNFLRARDTCRADAYCIEQAYGVAIRGYNQLIDG